jgi:hypothetical protein
MIIMQNIEQMKEKKKTKITIFSKVKKLEHLFQN